MIDAHAYAALSQPRHPLRRLQLLLVPLQAFEPLVGDGVALQPLLIRQACRNDGGEGKGRRVCCYILMRRFKSLGVLGRLNVIAARTLAGVLPRLHVGVKVLQVKHLTSLCNSDCVAGKAKQ